MQYKDTGWMDFKEQGNNKCDYRAANENNKKRTENIVSDVNVTCDHIFGRLCKDNHAFNKSKKPSSHYRFKLLAL